MDSKARSAAEEAIRSLGRGDVASARTAIAEAHDIDHTLGGLADAVYLACAEIEAEGSVNTSTWNTIADAVAHDQLLAVVEECR